MDAATIVRRVAEAGVAGAGGGGFPAHVKLKSRVDWVIANGAECEPLLYADQRLMEHRPQDVVRGMELAREATGASRAVIALKAKYKAARAALAGPAAAAGIDIFLLEDFYPAGDELVLVSAVSGRIVPPAGIPLNVGVLVQNVETLANIARAVDAGEPVTTKYLTVTGAVNQPVTVSVPVGTPIGDLVAAAGGASVPEPVLLDGGVMMGRVVEPMEPVTKRTGGVVVLARSHPWIRKLLQPLQAVRRQAMSVCIQCRFCTELCPRNLLGHDIVPNRLMLVESYGLSDPGAEKGALLCSECGLCEAFSCPEGLMPRQVVLGFKRRNEASGIRYQRRESAPERGLHPLAAERRVPSGRLKERLGVCQYDRPAPLDGMAHSPGKVILRLKQHAGESAQPVVSPGQMVAAGELVAQMPEGRLGVHLHASIGGRVAEVTEGTIVISTIE